MFIYGKMSANAVSVMSYLAEAPDRRAGSREIAKVRKLSQPLTAKLLTQLASAGLVAGQPGPGGGYMLAKAPKDICLFDIVSLFGQTDPPALCPFGPDWCGKGDPCPLHDKIADVLESNQKFMKRNTLAEFVGKPPRKGGSAAGPRAGAR